MGSTMIEKILARTAGRDTVRPGEIVVCKPDIIVQLDMPFYVDGFWYRPKKLADVEIALIFDHGMPAPTIKEAAGMREGRRFAREFGIEKVYDLGNHGISHVVAAEEGLVRPGELLINCDSHSCATGALNCAARGSGPLDVLQAMTQGVVWYPVTPTVRYEFTGVMPQGVNGKDVLFHIAEKYGGHSNTSIEFSGPGLGAMAMHDRRTLSTMCAEIGAEFVLFEHDDVTAAYLDGRLDREVSPVAPDSDADYLDVRTIDLSALEPYIVVPHSVPGNSLPLSRFDKEIPIDQAFIGSCANGQIEDLRTAAEILRGRKVAPGVRMIVTPGSQKIYLEAVREGIVETLVEAGAVVTNSTCGACLGYHMGVLAPGEVCITASTRNFKGRMGSTEADIYMGSPATVAAAALTGVISRSMTDQATPASLGQGVQA